VVVLRMAGLPMNALDCVGNAVFTESVEVTSAFADADTPATAMANVELRPVGAERLFPVSAPAFRIGRFAFAPRANAFDSRPRTHSAPAVNIALPKINTPISAVLINPFTPANNATQSAAPREAISEPHAP
jgi:hypothetical protein